MEIPDDIAFHILSKLPLKSLKRFSLVRKSWADLLEIPYFISSFRSNFLSNDSYYDDTSLLLSQLWKSDQYRYRNALYLLSGDKFEKRVQLDWPLQENVRACRVLGSGIHGTLCLDLGPGNNRLILWNPATQEYRVIPPSPRESLPYLEAHVTPHGFGYDPVTDDYKVIGLMTYFIEDGDEYHWEVEDEDEDGWQDESMILGPLPGQVEDEDYCQDDVWEIYSLRSNTWRKLDADMHITGYGSYLNRDKVYTNGVCHWFGRGPTVEYGFDIVLGSFNFSNEVFFTTLLPLGVADIMVQKCLVVLNGSIAVISKHDETTAFHISILGELGIKESWTKLFIVGPLHGVGLPIGMGRKGDIFFKKDNGELALFDLSTHTLKEMVAEGIVDDDEMIIYKESILLIGRTSY